LATLEVDFVAGKAEETAMQEPGLEALRRGIPAARGLPLLSALTQGDAVQIRIAYHDNHLNIRVTPC